MYYICTIYVLLYMYDSYYLFLFLVLLLKLMLRIRLTVQAFGTVTSVDMPKEGDRSKGFCFVEYASPEAAQMALSTMHNFVLKGR